MLLAQKNTIRHLPKEHYRMLLSMCRCANSLANVAEYNIREHYKETGKYLSCSANDKLSRSNENYRMLQANVSQQVLRKQDQKHQSFFKLLKAKENGTYTKEVNPPHFRPKGGYDSFVVEGMYLAERGKGLLIPMSRAFRAAHPGMEIVIPRPSNLAGKKIHSLEIRPAQDGSWIEAIFVYEEAEQNLGLDPDNVLGLDPGIDNFVAGAASDGATFLVDGRAVKSINCHYNKRKADLQSKLTEEKKHWSRQLTGLTKKRENRLQDFMHKTVRMIINFCIDHNCGTIVIGVNKGWKQHCNMGRVNNQHFTSIPHARFRTMLKSQCERYGIRYIEQEESYTSKASALDQDYIPTYDPTASAQYVFSGKRVKRGLYRAKDGTLINADINGAMNVIRKSKQNDPAGCGGFRLCNGGLDTPCRIRIV